MPNEKFKKLAVKARLDAKIKEINSGKGMVQKLVNDYKNALDSSEYFKKMNKEEQKKIKKKMEAVAIEWNKKSSFSQEWDKFSSDMIGWMPGHTGQPKLLSDYDRLQGKIYDLQGAIHKAGITVGWKERKKVLAENEQYLKNLDMWKDMSILLKPREVSAEFGGRKRRRRKRTKKKRRKTRRSKKKRRKRRRTKKKRRRRR